MNRVTFTDPLTAATYVWAVNPGYDGVTSPAQKQRQIERTSNTGNVGATKQQGDDGPYLLHWEFNVFTEAMEEALWEWYVRSQKQSIYLTDFRGDQYEGQIITLGMQEVGVLSGPGDTTARGFYVKTLFEFEVWRFISGRMANALVVA